MVLKDVTFHNIANDVKIFLAVGADDPCILNGRGIDGLYNYLKEKFINVRIKKFDGMRHEIQNEPSKNELLTSMERFLNE